jgi:hypothetical protein
MSRKLIWVAVLVVITFTATYVQKLAATDAFGFSGVTITTAGGGVGQGRFGDIDVGNQLVRAFGDATPQKDLWLSLQRTKGPSDLYVQSNTWTPGGSTGWHTHPGHSLIIVTEGEVTAYDESCAKVVYAAGNPALGIPNAGFVDEGGDHVHLLRNEGSIVARTVAVQLIPANAVRRQNVSPAPAGCPLL